LSLLHSHTRTRTHSHAHALRTKNITNKEKPEKDEIKKCLKQIQY